MDNVTPYVCKVRHLQVEYNIIKIIIEYKINNIIQIQMAVTFLT